MRVRLCLLGAVVSLGVVAAHASADVHATATRWIVFSATPKNVPTAQLFRVQTNGAGLEQITTGENIATNPAFSQDGKRIVFARLGVGLFVMNLDGTGLRRLTKAGHDHFPVWSPNGKQIAFLRLHTKAWRLYVMSPSGRGQRLLPKAPPAGRPSWTADSKSIYIPVLGALDRIDARTGRVQQQIGLSLDPYTSQGATLSPNAKHIAFLAPRPSGEGCGDASCIRYALFVADGPKWRPRRFQIDTGPAGWSSDSKTLVFVHKQSLWLWPYGKGERVTISTGEHAAQGDGPPAWQPR